MSDDRAVHGTCPMGCGRTLFLGDGGYVTCSYVHCPRCTAVDDLLGDRETEHIVELGETVFTVRHPYQPLAGRVMTGPTRLTPEDLPTLRKLAAFWEERKQHDFAHSGWWGTLARKTICGVFAKFSHRAIAAIERTGHLASDERADKHGRTGTP